MNPIDPRRLQAEKKEEYSNILTLKNMAVMAAVAFTGVKLDSRFTSTRRAIDANRTKAIKSNFDFNLASLTSDLRPFFANEIPVIRIVIIHIDR